MRGRVAALTRQRTCSCGASVPYEGAHDSLFSSSKETAFMRIFLEVMISRAPRRALRGNHSSRRRTDYPGR